MNLFIILIFSFLLPLNLSESIKIPFTTRFNENEMNKDNVMSKLINNDIISKILVGSNQQQIEMNIKLQKDSTFILSSTCKGNDLSKKFDEKQSTTYEILYLRKKYYMYEFEEATYSQDNFILLLNNNKQFILNNFHFMLGNSIWYDKEKKLGGTIGLILSNKDDIPKDTDFINQLKIKNIIDSYTFMLDYKDNYNGELYIGNYFHEFDENYSYDDFKSFKAGRKNFKVLSWGITVDNIISKNNIIQKETFIEFFYEMGIFASPQFYHKYINETFFKKYYEKGICEEKINKEEIAIFSKYEYIVCDKKGFNIESFPGLIFNHKEENMNFTFSYKDLFYEYENKYYFLVVFPFFSLSDTEYWYIGKPFFLKYKLFLDKDKKIAGVYKNFTRENEKEIIVLNHKSNVMYKIIIALLIIVLIIILYYFLIVRRMRKLRANELEDTYSYISKSKEEKALIEA